MHGLLRVSRESDYRKGGISSDLLTEQDTENRIHNFIENTKTCPKTEGQELWAAETSAGIWGMMLDGEI